MAVALIDHVELDEKGVARVRGSRIKVIHLVMAKMANGWGPEETQAQFPHLSLAEIYAAFAYYYDHKAELDEQIQESLRFADEMAAKTGESAAAKKLRAMGKLP
jgi:uncharacterized protein (DUF433 family)